MSIDSVTPGGAGGGGQNLPGPNPYAYRVKYSRSQAALTMSDGQVTSGPMNAAVGNVNSYAGSTATENEFVIPLLPDNLVIPANLAPDIDFDTRFEGQRYFTVEETHSDTLYLRETFRFRHFVGNVPGQAGYDSSLPAQFDDENDTISRLLARGLSSHSMGGFSSSVRLALAQVPAGVDQMRGQMYLVYRLYNQPPGQDGQFAASALVPFSRLNRFEVFFSDKIAVVFRQLARPVGPQGPRGATGLAGAPGRPAALYGRVGQTLATINETAVAPTSSWVNARFPTEAELLAWYQTFMPILDATAPASGAEFDLVGTGAPIRMDTRLHGPDSIIEFALATPPGSDFTDVDVETDGLYAGIYFRPSGPNPVMLSIRPQIFSNRLSGDSTSRMVLQLCQVRSGDDDIVAYERSETYSNTGESGEDSAVGALIADTFDVVIPSAAAAADRPWFYLKYEQTSAWSRASGERITGFNLTMQAETL